MTIQKASLALNLLLMPRFLSAEYNPDSWYQKYDHYPQYCSIPEEMAKRGIPALKENDRLVGETRLLHVTAVIRHGARTPYASNIPCWDGYWESEETGVWDCDLTTIMAPPSPIGVKLEEGDEFWWTADDSFFLFEKHYDALQYPEDKLTNDLNGTCQRGQLLLQGYEQEIKNGRILRDAYAFRYDDPYEHDERMRLIDLSFSEYSPWDPYHLRLRADDDQRTLMSGQVLLRGLFDEEVMASFYKTGSYPQIPVHTADRKRDILDANEEVCPKLRDIRESAYQSSEFQTWNHSLEVNATRNFLKKSLGDHDPTRILDCLMTTICTDRPLPKELNDYGTTTESKFDAAAEMAIRNFNFVMSYNNSEYAKLGLAPLWAEIMENINLVVNEPDWLLDTGFYESEMPVAPKLAVFSGHDTTIMPLLASLGPKLWSDADWAPYASMMIIEVHEIIDMGMTDSTLFTSDYAFRLLYNGEVLTEYVDGCSSETELCDIRVLQGIINPIATRFPDCGSEDAVEEDPPVLVIEQAKTLVSTAEGILLFLGLVIVNVLAGAVGAFVLLTGRLPFSEKKLIESAVEIDEDATRGLQTDNFEDEPTEGSFLN